MTLVAISDLAKQFEALKYLFESINLELVKWLDNLMHFLQEPLSRSFLFFFLLVPYIDSKSSIKGLN